MLSNKLIIGIIAVLITACSSSVEQLAQQNEWRDIGYSDGIKGRQSRSFRDLQALGQVNQADYDQGYVEGINEYCKPETAYYIGLSGQYYEGVCEGTESAQKFRMEWQRGWNEFK